MALGNSDRTVRKTFKSMSYDTAMYDQVTVDKKSGCIIGSVIGHAVS